MMWKIVAKSAQWPSSGHQLCFVRVFSVGEKVGQQLEIAGNLSARSDEKWTQAKTYEEMPGPNSLKMISYFMPGEKIIVGKSNHFVGQKVTTKILGSMNCTLQYNDVTRYVTCTALQYMEPRFCG